ncbi:MAG TPA: glycosyltransferase family 4 protein [Gaiellaceae bacterium]|nr:glycosyltransferase family 4 protein [Gaiellaceae bacterium]
MQTVLHLSQFDAAGGSARSAYKIHTELQRLGARSRMLVGHKTTDDPNVAPLAGSKNWWRANLAAYMLTERLSLQYAVSASCFALRAHPWFREATVLQLHNLHGGWFAHTSLPLLARARPTVWRLADMWPLTGHCSYSFECGRWRTGCGSCPHLDGYPPLRHDLSAVNWRIKDVAYRHSPMTIVAPSDWLASLARESPLLNRFPVRVIRTGVELDVFRPQPRAGARAQLGVPVDAPVVLVASREERKGAGLATAALGRLGARHPGLTALVFGQGETPIEPPATQVVALGMIDDRERLALAYAAADVLLYPTLADNLPNTILESMACGTPVVSLPSGGVPEAVTHLEDGYLVERAGGEALAEAVTTLLDDPDLRARLGSAAAARVRREFSVEAQGRAFLELYDEIAGAEP